MKITRDVITDLLPVYQSGEASQGTRDLVDAFLKEDPEFARIVNAQAEILPAKNQLNLPKENEMKTLEKTKKLLWQRSMYLGSALFFSLFAFAFSFGPQGIRWIWEGMPIVAGVCLALGIFFWARFAHATGKLKGSDL